METIIENLLSLFSFGILSAVVCLLVRGPQSLRWSRKLTNSVFVNSLFSFASMYGIFAIFLVNPVAGLYDTVFTGVQTSPTWQQVPSILKILLFFLLFDFCFYWAHRWLHTSWLWPSHAVHHSDTEMNFSTFARGHFTEQLVIALAMIFGTRWIGLNGEEAFWAFWLKGAHQYYIHARLDLGHGPLKYVVVSPRLHRWHHVDKPDAHDKNFASIFPIFDLMFGTYYNPSPSIDEPTGIPNSPGNDFVLLFIYPFVEWRRMLGRKFRPGEQTRTTEPAGPVLSGE